MKISLRLILNIFFAILFIAIAVRGYVKLTASGPPDSYYPFLLTVRTAVLLIIFFLVRLSIAKSELTEQKLAAANGEMNKLFNAIDEVLFSVDMVRNQVLQMSPACQKVYGYTAADFFADNELWSKVVHPDDKYVIDEIFKLLYSGTQVRKQYRIIHEDKSVRWIEKTIKPTTDEQGQLLRIDGVTRDITERKNAEEKKRISEERYREVSNNPLIGVTWAKEGWLIDASNAFCRMLGYTHDEIIGMHYNEFTHPDDIEEQGPLVLKLLNGEIDSVQLDKRYVTKNGDIIWAALNLTAIKDENGEIKYTIGVSQDITAKKKAQEELHQTHTRLLFHMENTPLGFIEWDNQLHVKLWSKRAEDIFGWTEEEFISLEKTGYCQVYKEDLPGVSKIADDLLSGRVERNSAQHRNYTKEGKVIWCEWFNSVLRDKDGKVVTIMSLVQDITERKNSEAEIIALNQSLEKRVNERTIELQQTNKELESFSYTVSHDLRAPLRIVNGYTKILVANENDTLKDESRQLLGVITSTVNHMKELIDDLLNFSKMGKEQLEKSTVDMNDEVKAVVEEVKQSLNGNFRTKIDLHPLPSTACDRALIKQVWSNIISNAVKYSGKKPDPQVEIGSTRNNGEVIYYVKDNGAGFNMKQADKLFNVFKRLHKASEYEGTGVGLALVHRIITRHGGRIWAEAKPEEGATFYFTLPVENAAV